jgi:gliding motility-associated-like protein
VAQSVLKLGTLYLLAIGPGLYAQCNTDLNKLLPDGSVNNEDRFGSGLAISDQYMVVAAENSDTLGIYFGGAAYVYEKTAAGWAYRAMLIPSDPVAYDFFGNKLAIDKDGSTIVILNRNYNKGGVYIYERPASGWETMTETAKVTLPVYLESDASVDISDDGSTIALMNAGQNPKYYLLNEPAGGWSDPVTLQKFNGPEATSSSNRYGADVLLHQDYLYISTDFDDTGSGIHVYKRDGLSYQYLAKLSTTVSIGEMGYFGRFLTAYDDVICTTGAVSEVGIAGLKLFTFKKNGEWADATETQQQTIPGGETSYRFYFPIQLLSSTELAASVLFKDGEYYTGRVLHVTAGNPDWQTLSSEVIFEEEGLSSRSEFAGTMEWNGSDLVRTVSLKSKGQSDRYAAVSLTHSGTVWGSLQHVTIDRNNSSYVNFGSAVVKNNDALFAGAPYDGFSGKAAGAVFIYEKSGDEFVRIHSIYPTRRKVRPTGGSDNGFGYSIAVHEDELAVAATSYKYAEEQYGKIFLYKRTTPSWTSATLYDSLIAPTELNLNHVGAALAMNDHLLFASAYNNFNNEHTNAVLVYEKIDDEWTFKQLLKLGKPLDKEWPTIRFSLNGDNILISSYVAIGGGVSLYSKNSTTGEWEPRLAISEGIFSGFGGDVKLLADHFFVGAPGYDYNGVLNSGAVFVYAKLPGQEWSQPLTPSAILAASTPTEGGYFGSSLDAIGNTLAVGAPGKFLKEDFGVRTVPGNTYIIQAQDYYWQHTTQFLNLQGDRYAQNERDHFGSDVGIDQDYFYIGARNENTATGMFSGAVYYIPTPPVIYLHPPVCMGSGVIQLSAYPFGGTWSGPGIEDPSGKFNPVAAGVGISNLKYTTPNCSFIGTVELEVNPPQVVGQISPADITLCSQASIHLQLESLGGTYDWYYKPEGNADFVFIGTGGAERTVTNPGEYFAKINGLTCPAESPVFNVHTEEDLQLRVGPQLTICEHATVIPLVASHDTGIWDGIGVDGKNFNSSNLANGFYELRYHFTTPSGCQIALVDSIKINVVQPALISRLPSDFCETGSALLQAMPDDPTLSFTWYFGATSGSGLSEIEKPLTSQAEVFEQGYYQVNVSNSDGCSATSQIVDIGFNRDLPFELKPGENSKVVVCDDSEFSASVQSRAGTIYGWEYKELETGAYDVISEQGQVTIRKNGYYRASGEYGFCSFESLPLHVQFASDSLFAPNVFSPNGDAYNQTFLVLSSQKIFQLKIFNRYGAEIYESSDGKWDGGEHPTGTYFWSVKYEGCDASQKHAKGWVSLLR